MKEPRPANRAGSRKESTRPGTSPEPAPAQAVMEDLNGLTEISSRESRVRICRQAGGPGRCLVARMVDALRVEGLS